MNARRGLALVITALLSGPAATAVAAPMAQSADPLAFVPENFEVITPLNITLDGAPLSITKYLVTYVANPVTMANAADVHAWEKMYIYVPSTAVQSRDAAIILQVNNSGWMNSPVKDIMQEGAAFVSTSDRDATGAALKAGYIIVSAGTRGRGLTAADGTYPGHAPAVVVDAKAAIRYLKYNDQLMPGSADKIVITGTSGGGGLSTAVAASGNSPNYYPYLKEIGAAGFNRRGKSTLTDDVFATIAYCPITNFNQADSAYEWQYGATRLIDPNYTEGSFDQTVSKDLAALYPAALKSLKLRLENGARLTVDTMPGAITALVKTGIEKALTSGVPVPDLGEDWTFNQFGGKVVVVTNDWLDIDQSAKTVVGIDYAKYLEFVAKTAKLKTPPAFDNYGTPLQAARTNESNLAGNSTQEYSHWLKWSWDNDNLAGNGVGLDDTGLVFNRFLRTKAGKAVTQQMKLINPIPFLLSRQGDSAPYWYVRHGMRDRDTSFAIEVSLFHAIRNDRTVKEANYALAYMQPHAGNYDVQEAYRWLAGVLAKAQ